MNLFEDFYYNKTNGFSTAAVDDFCEHGYSLDMIKESIDNIADQAQMTIEKNCRIYVNSHQVNSFRAKQIMVEARQYENFNEIDWTKIIGEENFFIFINFAALYCDRMSEQTKTLLGGFYTHFDPDGISIEHHVIIGKYDETPFGVHIDDPEDRVFHFNVGDSKKKVYLWDRKQYLDKYQSSSSRPLAKADMSDAVEYDLSKGSAFFLPANYYHCVTSSEGISAVVALAFSRASENLQLQSAFEELKKITLKGTKANKYFDNFSISPINDNKLSAWERRNSIQLEQLLKQSHARNASNKYIMEISSLDLDHKIPESRKYFISEDVNLVKILINGTMKIFSNGHDCELASSDVISSVNKIINDGFFEFDVENFTSSEITERNIAAFHLWLIRTNSVK